jgi:hypothetical protein
MDYRERRGARARVQWQTPADCGRLPGIRWVLRKEEAISWGVRSYILR